MEKLNRSLMEQRPYLPDCWADDKRMDVLFNPFRIRDINPEGWDLKMNFWINLINKWCLHERKAVFTIDELRKNFIRDERLPHLECIKLVASHMKRQNKLLFKDEIKSNQKNLRSYINISSTWGFFMKPFTHGWKMVVNGEDNTNSIDDQIMPMSQDFPLVNKETLEILAESVESTIKTMDTTCIGYSKFLNFLNQNVFAEKNSDEASLEVVLDLLESKNKLKIHEESGFKIVKFGNDSQIKDADVTLVRLEMTKETLEKEASRLEESIENCDKQARVAIRNGNKDKALFLLKRKKRFENRLMEKDQQIDNIEIICGQLLETGSQQLMLKALQMANEMLKKNTAKVNDVENIMFQIDETLNDVANLTTELNRPFGDTTIIENEAEKELEELLEEMSTNNDSLGEPDQSDLIESVNALKIQDDNVSVNRPSQDDNISNKKVPVPLMAE